MNLDTQNKIIKPSDVTVVTVTYGNRKKFVNQLIKAVLNEKIFNLIIVDNGSEWDIDYYDKGYKKGLISVLKMGENTGSAMGFYSGIEYAINSGSKYLWLLDDDNKPEKDSLKVLISHYTDLLKTVPEDNLAVNSYRPTQQTKISTSRYQKRINPRKSSFHGFHIFDIPQKILYRLPFSKKNIQGNTPQFLCLDSAPYGGLFLNYKLIKKIGLPRKDFVLYEDDTEYTYRITKNSGKIFCVLASKIDDMEISWNAKKRFNNSFSAILNGTGDFKAFYNMRNCTYLDEYVRKNNNTLFYLNKTIYILLLKIISIIHNKPERYRLLREAINDGKHQIMGIKSGLPLPTKNPPL